MTGLETFTPDDDYCVYCHAPAAGLCAECGALCCGECVELVMGWTTRRAVCSPCLSSAEAAGPASRSRTWLIGAIAIGGAAVVATYLVVF